jgi:acyl carrier protein
MEKKLFLVELQNIIQSNRELSFEDKLLDLDDYDSLVQMSLAAWLSDNFGVECKISDVSNFNTVEDVFNFIIK